MIRLHLNGEPVEFDVAADTPLLWALREQARLSGTKFGCGIGACGACTVHLNGAAVRACLIPVGSAAGGEVTTIEGLGRSEAGLALQRAWIQHQVPQCGYCQSGMLMAVTALLAENPAPTDALIDQAITNICRCGTYERIRRAIHSLAGGGDESGATNG